MKILKFILPLALVFFMTGCIDETVEIKNDGSGQLTMDMDMSQMVDMMLAYIPKEDLAKNGLQKMDTTIHLKDVVDTISSIPADKKAVLRPGTVHIKLDMDAKVFNVHMLLPFSSQENLQKLYTALNDGSISNAQLLKGMGGEGGAGGPDPSQFNSIFDYTCKDGLLVKQVNKDKLAALQKDPKMAQVKQVGAMGIEIEYTTTIKFPRPVKKIDNPLGRLSEDKKTVSFRYNLIDMFDHADKFGYNIEY